MCISIEYSKGLTLIELMICLAILSVSMAYMSPSLYDSISRNRAATAINWIVHSVNFARHAAVTYNTTVTLCPSRDGRRCGGKWHEGSIAFTDSNMDRLINGGDHQLRRFEFPVDGATVKWRAFRNRQYLQMRNTGYTNWQNGNFVYCLPDNDPRFARQLVINMPGRARLSTDRDHDGIVEDRNGRDLECD